MQQPNFEADIAHMRRAIARAPLQDFAVPHLVTDRLFPKELIVRINENWPEAECFAPEVPGNHIIRLFRNDYTKITGRKGEFWQAFNEILWPALLAACAEAIAEPAYELFGGLYHSALVPDWPMTLMQADATYPGHGPHQHFYHAPHWAFTVLIYVDPDDIYSKGTGIHRLKAQEAGWRAWSKGKTSYRLDDLDRRIDVAMRSFNAFKWDIPDPPFERKQVDYKANRLFMFMDGPLAVHSVSFDKGFIPNPLRAVHASTHGRRRILRCHVKIDHGPFYAEHSKQLPEPLDPERYMRVMAPDAVLSPEDQRYRNDVVHTFYHERLTAYARAAERAAEVRRKRLWSVFTRRKPEEIDYASQFSRHIL